MADSKTLGERVELGAEIEGAPTAEALGEVGVGDGREGLRARLRQAFRDVGSKIARGRPLILDSFCGTGQSTRMLAVGNPDALVVGIDKSSERLRKQAEPLPDNALLLRAE